jgi:MFS family permease
MVVFAGAQFWSISTIAAGLVPGVSWLFVARSGVGIGEASLIPAAYTLIGDKFPKDRLNRALSIFAMGPKLGQSIALAGGGMVIALAQVIAAQGWPLVGGVDSWRLVFVIIGGIGLLLGLLPLTFAEPVRGALATASPDEAPPGSLLDYISKHRLFVVCLLVGFTLVSVAGQAMYAWVPTYMERVFRWPAARFGPVLGAASLAAAAALFVHGFALDLLVRRGVTNANLKYYIALLMGAVPIVIVAFVTSNVWIFIVLLAAFQIVALPWMLFFSSTVQFVIPKEIRGRFTALALSIFSVVGLAGSPLAVASLTDFVFRDPMKLGWSLAIVCAVACAGGCLALWGAMSQLHKATVHPSR